MKENAEETKSQDFPNNRGCTLFHLLPSLGYGSRSLLTGKPPFEMERFWADALLLDDDDKKGGASAYKRQVRLRMDAINDSIRWVHAPYRPDEGTLTSLAKTGGSRVPTQKVGFSERHLARPRQGTPPSSRASVPC